MILSFCPSCYAEIYSTTEKMKRIRGHPYQAKRQSLLLHHAACSQTFETGIKNQFHVAIDALISLCIPSVHMPTLARLAVHFVRCERFRAPRQYSVGCNSQEIENSDPSGAVTLPVVYTCCCRQSRTSVTLYCCVLLRFSLVFASLHS